MITLDKAIDIVLSNAKQINKVERVDLWNSIGRVLSANVISDMNMPPFNKTAVDGYACRMSDAKGELEVIETIPAGVVPTKTVTQGQCSKIMTGAMIPKGADCVLMVEDVKEIGFNRIVFTGETPRANICILGEDMKTGEVAIQKGTTLSAQHIAIMAALGCTQPTVSVKPSVAVLVTGDELVEPQQKPTGGQIRNSNGHQLVGQILKANAKPNYIGIVKDTEEATYNAISNALKDSDIVILTGGVSMGDYDYVPSVMKKLGIQILFDSISVQPGKPTKFGIKDGKMIFGLPGNPVSSYMQFEILVKPTIQKLMGGEPNTKSIVRLPLANGYQRKKVERLGLIPILVNANNKVEAVDFHGSAHIFALAKTDGYIMIPLGESEIKEGELVDVRPL
ncbi:MAG: molybdopterin molybdenumtransferase MoeA [Bacteroidales bacterium]|nr:MAG: molybdopterin molybdenumtransferase MoeA [Bacteroidales bacterium]